MKNLSIIFALLLTAWVSACAPETTPQETPEQVLTAFGQKFPTATKVAWGKEGEREWEAEFTVDNQAYSANFSQSGEWTETEYNIGESAIPENIKALLDANFTDYEVEAAEIAETAAGTSYEFEIEVGENELEVMIDPQGNLTQKQLSEENEDKD